MSGRVDIVLALVDQMRQKAAELITAAEENADIARQAAAKAALLAQQARGLKDQVESLIEEEGRQQ